MPRRKKNDTEIQPPPPLQPPILPATPLVTGPPKGVQSQEQQPTKSEGDEASPANSSKLDSNQKTSVISGAMTILEDEFLPSKQARYESGLVMQAVEYAQSELLRHHNCFSQRAY